MDSEFWDKIKHFDQEENWGDWRKVNPQLIINLDKLRELANKPIVIHCAYATRGHSEHSQHYKGLAADLHIVGLNAVDQFLLAEKSGLFTGIGIYPYWNNPGLHLDIRDGAFKRWACNAAGVYTALNSKFLQEALNSE